MMNCMSCLQLLHEGITTHTLLMNRGLQGCLLNCMSCLQLLHEGIAKFNGYEINTEGDSFHIAFTSVAAAVQVAMETQVRLLDSDWPKDVLKLPACGQVMSVFCTLIAES